MQPAHRRILKAAGQVASGLVVGAVCGFALLSVGFVLRNQYASPGTALVIVVLAAAVGGAVVGARLWRGRPARDTSPTATRRAGPPAPWRPAFPSVRMPWVVVRDRTAAERPDPATVATEGQPGVAAVPDAA